MKILKALGLLLSMATVAMSAYDLVKVFRDHKKALTETEIWLKGYVAGNKDFKRYLEENDPELLEEIES